MAAPIASVVDRPIYLDYAATTPVDPRVAAVLCRYLQSGDDFGNPASHTHGYGRLAAHAVEEAGVQVAELLGVDPRELVWTSGATEANNLAIKGAMAAHARRGRHLITCKTEHKAVLDVCRELVRQGFEVSWLDPEPDGRVDPERLAAALRDDTVLVSIMHVNNETGVVQDLSTLGERVHDRGALFHVDAAQSAGKLPIELAHLPVDLMSISAHKLYGPKGVGALYIRRRPKVRLTAQIHGGGQQRGLRAGTLPVHQIAAMGEACRIIGLELDEENRRLEMLRERLWEGIADLEGVSLHGHLRQRVAGILNIGFAGVNGESLLLALDELALSAGSACASANHEPSHVLRAMGLDDAACRGALRLSLGRFTTEAEIDRAVVLIRRELPRLRSLSPLWGSTAIQATDNGS